MERFADLLAISLPPTVMDIDAGSGNLSLAMADLESRVKAVEPSEAMRIRPSLFAESDNHLYKRRVLP